MSTNHSRSPGASALAGLTALGVVFGDIGTSPLYAMRETLHHFVSRHGRNGPIEPFDQVDVLGVLSMITWLLILVVTVKYVAYVLRAENAGEGGILALLALALDPKKPQKKQRVVLMLGLFGAALLYGEGVITPAISVLGALEGVSVEAPALGFLVVPMTVVLMIVLFAFQRFGTEKVGMAFGPIMLVWFVVLAILGAVHIVAEPQVLKALSPHYGVVFFMQHKLEGMVVLGAVVLAVTGAEALYADMGHFGVQPIRFAWLIVVLPALLLNYFGQGALLLRDPSAIQHPLMHMAPEWGRIPLLVLSTVAAFIASQALISGTYSLTRQAILLGFAPRLRVVHTSPAQIGQIYMPGVNFAMMIVTIALVVGFQSSSRLAAAYGIGVTMTMCITTILAGVVALRRWKWPWYAAIPISIGFMAMDFSLLAGNAVKLRDGGWVPIAIAISIFTLMTTWQKGRELLAQRIRERSVRFEDIAGWIKEQNPTTVSGTAVYLTAHPDSVPLSLVDNVRHNHALHERVILLSLVFTQNARVSITNRLRVEHVDDRVVRVFGYYGFVERPDVPSLLELALVEGIEIDPQKVSFVMGRETLLATERAGMAMWRESLFAAMSRNAQRAAAFFGIPSDRVLEVGAQIEL
jgi:KUP system potassium uptake protein